MALVLGSGDFASLRSIMDTCLSVSVCVCVSDTFSCGSLCPSKSMYVSKYTYI